MHFEHLHHSHCGYYSFAYAYSPSYDVNTCRSAVVCRLHSCYCELCECEHLVCIIAHCFRKCRWRLIQHHGLWWILLLLYSHLVHTSVSILDCPMLRDPSDQIVRPVSFCMHNQFLTLFCLLQFSANGSKLSTVSSHDIYYSSFPATLPTQKLVVLLIIVVGVDSFTSNITVCTRLHNYVFLPSGSDGSSVERLLVSLDLTYPWPCWL